MPPVHATSPWGLMDRDDWDWFQFKTGAFDMAKGETKKILTRLDLPEGWRKGYLHSLDLQVSSSSLFVQIKTASQLGRSPVTIEGTLADFLSSNFDHRVVMPGDPVVVDRAALGLATPPEFTARIGPSFFLPFTGQFEWTFRNDATSATSIYGHILYFILFKENSED